MMVALRTRVLPFSLLETHLLFTHSISCWWDSAGFTYSHQLGGLLAYNISPSFLLYGSDYPYIPPSLVDASAEATVTSPFLTEEDKHKVRSENAQRLFAGRKAVVKNPNLN
ncbi:hypothetical protein K438DRAFT_1778265 [Mycena galopus ATCC 62051]|nr:hypothetical protein K438DRAFT_1778265 [Mycena galopus ATCC 62051]